MAGRGTDIQLGGNLDMRIAEELKEITDEGDRAATHRQPSRPKSKSRAKKYAKLAACL